MTGLIIERAKPLAERIDFLNKTQSIHRSDSRSSAATTAFGRSGSAHNIAQSANAMAIRFLGHGLAHTMNSTNFLDNPSEIYWPGTTDSRVAAVLLSSADFPFAQSTIENRL